MSPLFMRFSSCSSTLITGLTCLREATAWLILVIRWSRAFDTYILAILHKTARHNHTTISAINMSISLKVIYAILYVSAKRLTRVGKKFVSETYCWQNVCTLTKPTVSNMKRNSVRQVLFSYLGVSVRQLTDSEVLLLFTIVLHWDQVVSQETWKHQHCLKEKTSLPIHVQTPLVRFAVDLLYKSLYRKSTANWTNEVWAIVDMQMSTTSDCYKLESHQSRSHRPHQHKEFDNPPTTCSCLLLIYNFKLRSNFSHGWQISI